MSVRQQKREAVFAILVRSECHRCLLLDLMEKIVSKILGQADVVCQLKVVKSGKPAALSLAAAVFETVNPND